VPVHLERWRSRLRAWAASEWEAVKKLRPDCTDVQGEEGVYGGHAVLLPVNPSSAYKYVILAAVNDAVIGETADDTGVVIAPWPLTPGEDEEHNNLFVQSAAYFTLKLRVGEITKDDAGRLLGFLDDVCDDLGVLPSKAGLGSEEHAAAHLEQLDARVCNEPAYLFRDAGAVYQVRFEGETGTIDAKLKGAKCVFELLQHPNRLYAASDLHALTAPVDKERRSRREWGAASDEAEREHEMERGPERDTGATDLAANQEALRQYRDRLTEIDPMLERARKDHDTVQTDILQQEKDCLCDEVRHMTGLGGKVRRPLDANDKARSSVTRAINLVISKCRQEWHLRKLADHLEACIEPGRKCIYRPSKQSFRPAPDWHF